jgi:hypothetical protein
MTYEPIKELKEQGVKTLQYMQFRNYKIRALNIVYFEGLDTDLKTVNNDRIDYWNDVRSVITDKGDVLMAATATTEPGWYYRLNRMNTNGAAQLQFGQYLDCWQIGDHRGQDALVQCGDLEVCRDANQDGSRTGDKAFIGSDYGLNQHTTNVPTALIGRWSAGCLVGKYPATHAKFMGICRSMGLRRFDTTLIDGTKFNEFKGLN